MGLHRNVEKKFFSAEETNFIGKNFSWIFFERHFYQWEYREPMVKKKKIYFGKNTFFTEICFPKKIDWFGVIHQWVYTRMMIKIKWITSEKKFLSRCFFFKKEFWITILSVGVQSANVNETVFRVVFLVIEIYFRENRTLNGLVKLIKRVTQDCCKKV